MNIFHLQGDGETGKIIAYTERNTLICNKLHQLPEQKNVYIAYRYNNMVKWHAAIF